MLNMMPQCDKSLPAGKPVYARHAGLSAQERPSWAKATLRPGFRKSWFWPIADGQLPDAFDPFAAIAEVPIPDPLWANL
jgi:hypothetical protein